MEPNKLLQEIYYLEYTPDILKESIDKNNGKLVVPATLQMSDTLNENGRVYPRPILEREVNKYLQLIKERRSMGELDHPDYANIELSKVSHLVTEAWWDGNVVKGKIEVLPTPSGNVLRSLLLAGVKVGISSRALGSTVREGSKDVVQEDLALICFDAVSTPSTPGAFIFEGVNNINQKIRRDLILAQIESLKL